MIEIINQLKEAATGLVDMVTGGHGDQIDAVAASATDLVEEMTGGGAASIVTEQVSAVTDQVGEVLQAAPEQLKP